VLRYLIQMLMKLVRVAAVLSIIVVVLGIVGINVVLSVKEDASAMREENLGIFLVNPESRQVELAAVLVQSTGETLPLRSSQSVGGTSLKMVFAESEKEGAYSIAGTELAAYSFPADGGIETKRVRIDRVVVVEDEILAELLRPAGVQRIQQSFGDIQAVAEVNASTLLEMLRGNMDAVVWEVSFPTPLMTLSRRATTSELLKMAEAAGISLDEELVKAYILAEFGKSASPSLQKQREQTLATLLTAYREGRIRIYPENTLTRALKYLPESLLMKMVGAA